MILVTFLLVTLTFITIAHPLNENTDEVSNLSKNQTKQELLTIDVPPIYIEPPMDTFPPASIIIAPLQPCPDNQKRDDNGICRTPVL
ncbi:hypothetical protein M0802_011252 [Mischocyttarus mexicanus]|nr:hypothetical protein M0802_011252 [Mischocyttarus mexicanus]